MDKREETKLKILASTIECIERYGIANTTTRNISEFAGVNLSAISYYFQGRDNLINLAFEQTMNNAFSIDDIEIKESDDYKSVLLAIVKDWIQGAFAYPNITRAHIDSVVNQKPQGGIMINNMKGFLNTVYNVLVEHNMPDNQLQMKKLHFIYSALFGYIMLNSFEKNPKLDEEFLQILLTNI